MLALSVTRHVLYENWSRGTQPRRETSRSAPLGSRSAFPLASPRTNRSISESLAYDARKERCGTAGIIVAERHAIAETEIETARQTYKCNPSPLPRNTPPAQRVSPS